MKKLLFILFIMSVLELNAQTKGDTQAWIKATIEEYHYKNQYHSYQVYFFDEGKTMTIVTPIGDKYFYDDIPLKEIKQVFVKEFADSDGRVGYSLILLCAHGTECSPGGTIVNGVKIPNPNSSGKELRITLDISLKNVDMNARLKKAVVHLITLNGGNVISEAF